MREVTREKEELVKITSYPASKSGITASGKKTNEMLPFPVSSVATRLPLFDAV